MLRKLTMIAKKELAVSVKDLSFISLILEFVQLIRVAMMITKCFT